MDGDRRRLVEEIFQQAADLPLGERPAFLAGRCDGDVGLKSEVESLLAEFDGGTTGLLGTPPASVLADLEGVEKIGDTVGWYRLCEILGEGGFGTVYRAEQTEPIRREVALKVIKLGMDTRRVVARFEAERQALAIMDHPNLARVLDAGATERGRPYFVMELVRGEPIVRFCDERRLGVEARLGLFLQVCDAVQHAHQKGLIHRDLKPSNILVAENDGKPLVKVIDFGIAKAIADGTGAAATLATEAGHVIGTPAYMSPEQAGALGGDIDTRTDIYSLGVVLYELLTGTTPLDLRKASGGGIGEVQRAIREQEPERPSTRVRTAGELTAGIAARRGADPAHLRRRLRGDLDWITMRAMEKDRARRYGSVAEFAADVRRHLTHEPVLAGPPGAGYRTRKFVRRHRAGVALAALAVLGLAGTSVGTGIGMIRALRAEAASRELATRESEARAKAERAAAEATAVRDFLARDVLSSIRPEQARGRTVTMEEVLANASERIGGAFPDQPGVEAFIRDVIAGTYRRLGKLEEAEAHLRRAYELQQIASKPGEHPRGAAANNLAVVLRQLGRFDEAEALYREALEMYRAMGPQGEPDVAATLTNLVTLLSEQTRVGEAVPLAEESVALHRKLFGNSDYRTGITLDRYGVLLSRRDRHDEAVATLTEAVTIMRGAFGDDHPGTATAKADLGTVLVAAGRAAEAEPVLREAESTFRTLMGTENAMHASVVLKLAEAARVQGRPGEAEPMLRSLLATLESVLTQDHPVRLQTQRQLGLALIALERTEEGERALLDAYAATQDPDEPRVPDALLIAGDLALMYERLGRTADAEAWRAKGEIGPADQAAEK